MAEDLWIRQGLQRLHANILQLGGSVEELLEQAEQTLQEDNCEVNEMVNEVLERRCSENVMGAQGSQAKGTQKYRLHDRWLDLFNAQEDQADNDQVWRQHSVKDNAMTSVKTMWRGDDSTNGTRKRRNTIFAGKTRQGLTMVCPFSHYCEFFRQEMSHPFSRLHLGWDLMGAFLLAYDMMIIPYTAAWDLDIEIFRAAFIMHLFALCFWGLDMFKQFGTGFFQDGTLVTSTKAIGARYLQGWFGLDFSCFIVDVLTFLMTAVPAMLPLKLMRMMRLIRLVRMAKFRRLVQKIEDSFNMIYQARFILVVTIVNVMVVLFFIIHVLACLWFAMGRASGPDSWLEHRNSDEETYIYALCFHWVLSQFTPAPPPFQLTATNFHETVFNICVIFVSLLVLGSVVSKMNNTINELRRWNGEVIQRRRQVNQFLVRHNVPLALSVRITRFVDNNVQRAARTIEDSGILAVLSRSLRRELSVVQRGPSLDVYPLFSLLAFAQPKVFQEICVCLSTVIFEASEIVFASGSWAESMFITVHGSYALEYFSRGQTERRLYHEEQYIFSDLCLFTRALHTASLTAETVADAFCLTSSELMSVVRNSPTCIIAIVEYANELLAAVSLLSGSKGEEVNIIKDETKKTALNKTTLATQANELLDMQNQVRRGSSMDSVTGQKNNKFRSSMESAGTAMANAAYEVLKADDKAPRVLTLDPDSLWVVRQEKMLADVADRAFEQPCEESRAFLRGILTGKMPAEREKLIEAFAKAFPELGEEDGTLMRLFAEDERKKSMAAMLNVVWLVTDNYQEFVQGQDPAQRMTPEVWQNLQRLGLSKGFSEKLIEALFCFLAVRGLPKSRSFLALVPPEWKHQPETAVLYAMQDIPDLVPSVKALDSDMVWFLRGAILINSRFNLAQLLQGENLPSSVALLRSTLNELAGDKYPSSQGNDILDEQVEDMLLRFYLLALIATMTVAVGSPSAGALFLDKANGATVVLAVRKLLRAGTSEPMSVYWSYVWDRAVQLGLREPCTEERLAIARLTLLCRVRAKLGLLDLQTAWGELGSEDKSSLAEALLADGVQEEAFLFNSLPSFLAHARNNCVVGLRRALQLLVDLLEVLRVQGWNERAITVTVDLSELAAFTLEVRVRHVFEACMGHAKLVEVPGRHKDRVRLTMSSKNWNRVRDLSAVMEDRLVDHTQLLRQICRRQGDLSQSMAYLERALGRDRDRDRSGSKKEREKVNTRFNTAALFAHKESNQGMVEAIGIKPPETASERLAADYSSLTKLASGARSTRGSQAGLDCSESRHSDFVARAGDRIVAAKLTGTGTVESQDLSPIIPCSPDPCLC